MSRPGAVSADWGGPESVYAPWEMVVESWNDFQNLVNDLVATVRARELVWRGVRRAEWETFSSLYRVLRGVNGADPPTEDQMVQAERRMLEAARNDWRFDHLPALEIMASLQHLGAPTRLLDVTDNPLIALWFAVESHPHHDTHDGRVFAFMVGSERVRLDADWGGRDLPWHRLETHAERVAADWGTGLRKRVWRPPAYNSRISAQNAGFIIDGVPIEGPAGSIMHKRPGSDERWTLDEVKATSSLQMRLSRVDPAEQRPGSSPAFTYRITAEAKPEIRAQLELRYGYRASAIYSDMVGLAEHIRDHAEEFGRDQPDWREHGARG